MGAIKKAGTPRGEVSLLAHISSVHATGRGPLPVDAAQCAGVRQLIEFGYPI
jgi:hypothetical protein